MPLSAGLFKGWIRSFRPSYLPALVRASIEPPSQVTAADTPALDRRLD
jgi:hypothetical protein